MTVDRRFISGIVLVITGILVASNIYSLIPLYSAIGEEFGISISEVAIGSTLFTFSYAMGLLFFGPFSDRFGRKFTLNLGLLLSSCTTILVSFAVDPASLYVFRTIQGFTLASFAPVAFAYCFEIFTEKDRTMWIALINTGFLSAGIIGQLISTIVLNSNSWEMVYVLFGLVYFLLFFVEIVLLPKTAFKKTPEKVSKTLKQMIELIGGKQLRILYTLVISLLFAFVSFYEAFNYLLLESNTVENILLIRSAGIFGAILSTFTGYFIAKYTANKTLFVGVLLGWFSTFLLLLSNSVVMIAWISVIFVASIALLIPTIINLIGSYSGENRGKALSLYSFILLVGASVGPLIAAVVTYKTMMLILFIAFTLNLLLNLSTKK